MVALGWPDELVGTFSVPASDDLLRGFTLASPEPVVVARTSLASSDSWHLPYVRRAGVTSGVGVGISGSGGPFGVLVGHTLEHRAFDPADVLFFESLATVLGPAIQRRHAQQQLEETERRYRTLVERLPVVTYVAELGPSGRWLYVSPQIESMTGYDAEEWTARPDLWFECVHPDDRDLVEEAEARCAREGGPLDMEYRLIARDGRTVWVRDEARATRRDAEAPNVIEGVLVDITDERLANGGCATTPTTTS